MADWRYLLQSKRAKYFVLAFALVDGAGLYFVNNRLSQPWTPPSGAAADATFAEVDFVPAPIPVDRDLSPALAIEDLPDPMPLARAYDFAPLPDLLKEIAIAVPEAPAKIPSVKLASRSTVRTAPQVPRYLRASNGDRQFASAFATDISGSAASTMTLPEPAFGLAPALPADAVPAAGSEPAAVPLAAEIETPVADNVTAAEAPVQDPVADIPAELPSVDAGPKGDASPS